MTNEKSKREMNPDRREFFKTAGAGLTAAGLLLSQAKPAAAALMTEKDKLDRIATNTWPIRYIFNTRAPSGGGGGNAQNPERQMSEQMQKKYGVITMLDFPQFTKDRFPGVTHMDLFSRLFGDITDDSMYVAHTATYNGDTSTTDEFDPSSASGKKWLEKLAAKMSATGTHCQHISNNAPTNICVPDDELRKAGVAVAKKWLDGAAILGAKSMRVNSGGPRIMPASVPDPVSGFPKNDVLARYLKYCIESFKEMADYGGDRGVRVTLENHWGLTANPMNIRIVIDEVNHPYCEASPDFGNWEHEYLLSNGLKALAPYSHTNVHAKYWDRWGDNNDIPHSTRIMLASGFKGTFALEYEVGPWDGVEGAQYVFKQVMAGLSSPAPPVI
jgi:sugar phosphate isomerase/epimerase